METDKARRERALLEYHGCEVYESYTELYGKDFDVVVNAAFSDEHYSITRKLLEHGFNVVVEKPFARNRFECEDLIRLAKEKGVMLTVFQQSLLAPMYTHAKEIADSGILGRLTQISLRYNGFSRRWDWQTMQARLGGSVYNTGPHPIGMALAFLDFGKDIRVEYSKLDRALTSGDAEDFAKIILSTQNGPVVDIEISATDAFADYNIKLQGTLGTYKSNTKEYRMKYITKGENPPRPLIRKPLCKENGEPSYCTETLIKHESEGEFGGTAFDVAVDGFYRSVHAHITSGAPLDVTAEMAMQVIEVIETVHAHNPLSLKY